MGIIGGIVIWPIDAFVDSITFSDEPFSQELFHPSPLEIYFRLTVMLFMLTFGLYAQRQHNKTVVSEERFELALRGANDGVWDWDLTKKQVYLSRHWKKMLGYEEDEFPDRPDAWIKLIDPLERDSFLQQLRKTMDGDNDCFEAEVRMQHKDNSWRTILCRGYLARDPATCKPVRLVGTHVDITKRKSIEERLHHLSQAVHHAGEAIIITDKDAVIEYSNPAFTEITGYSNEEIIGKKPSILKSSAQDPKFYKELWETITRGEVWHGTLIDRKKDGTFFPTLMTVAPIFNEEGEITHFVSTHQDLTEIRRMEEQIQHVQKMESIGTLVGGIAHDFNNKLAAILGNLYLARLEIDQKDEVLTKLTETEDIGRKAADVVKQLLTFARKDHIDIGTFPLNFFLKEAFKLARNSICSQVHVRLEICDEPLVIKGDTAQLQQVLINLLNNASDAVENRSNPEVVCTLQKFTPTRSFVSQNPDFSWSAYAQLSVRDNGIGIDPEHLSKVFEPFFTTKEVGKGTGLGLSTVYGSITMHNGLVSVDSEPGNGTTFHIYLPLIEEKGDIEEENPHVRMGSGETILLVDDEESMLSITADVLSSMNYTVLKASDGKEALKQFNEHHENIDLILTDIVMPEMSGIELARTIRKSAIDLPIVFMTGYNKETTLPSGSSFELSMVLAKPFSAEKISRSIYRMLRRKAAQKS